MSNNEKKEKSTVEKIIERQQTAISIKTIADVDGRVNVKDIKSGRVTKVAGVDATELLQQGTVVLCTGSGKPLEVDGSGAASSTSDNSNGPDELTEKDFKPFNVDELKVMVKEAKVPNFETLRLRAELIAALIEAKVQLTD